MRQVPEDAEHVQEEAGNGPDGVGTQPVGFRLEILLFFFVEVLQVDGVEGPDIEEVGEADK
jgi:hypothetical protein